eukprot:1676423-Amphidinium_carterae.1
MPRRGWKNCEMQHQNVLGITLITCQLLQPKGAGKKGGKGCNIHDSTDYDYNQGLYPEVDYP